MESKRQLQLGKLIQFNLSEIFQREGVNLFGRAMITISIVRLTADLGLARCYVSIYNVEDKQPILDQLEGNAKALRVLLGRRIRNKVRQIPELEFHLDDTLDSVFRMQQLFEDLDLSKNEEE